MAFPWKYLLFIVFSVNIFNRGEGCIYTGCQNGGTCNTGLSICTCPKRYYGTYCESDRCYCGQHGLCLTDNTEYSGYKCQCYNGFSGSFCGIDTRPCSSYPCNNGATCTNNLLLNSYTCLCDRGYYGTNCDTYIGRCSSQPCQNGGTCNDLKSINDYTCSCNSDHWGINCEYNFVSIPAIAGGVVGGVFLLIIVVSVIIIIVRRSRRPQVLRTTNPTWTLAGQPAHTSIATVNMASGQAASAPYPPNAVPGPYVGYPVYSNTPGGPPAYSTLVPPPVAAEYVPPPTYPSIPNMNETKSATPNY